MYCTDDTGNIPAVDRHKWVRVEMRVQEVQEVVPIVEKIRVVRDAGNGDGRLTIPLTNGFLQKIETTLVEHPKLWRWLKRVGQQWWRSVS